MDFDVFALDRLGLKFSVRDPIHGFIRFNEWEKSIIDHPWFQRLRRIRQLAFTEYIYPGASHTRFEHSLGVMHVATRMFLRVITKCKSDLGRVVFEYGEDEQEEFTQDVLRTLQLIRLGALLHDVGHGPFSHAAESVYPLRRGDGDKRLGHEDYSVAAIKMLTEIIDDSDHNKVDPKIEAGEVANLLEDSIDPCYSRRLQPLAAKILSSQLDADKLDYLLRDSHHVGVAYGLFDLERVIEALSFCVEQPHVAADMEDEPSPEVLLAIEESDRHVAESVVIARDRMFSAVYFHKTRRIFDLMLGHALAKIIDEGLLPAPDCSGNLDSYLKWDDVRVLNALLHIKEHESTALARAIRQRNFPRLIAETDSMSTLETIKVELRKLGMVVVTDHELAEGQSRPAGDPDIWMDTRTKFTTYKHDESLEIKLRPRQSVVGPDASVAVRFAPKRLSTENLRIRLEDALKPGYYRVYSTEDKRKAASDAIRAKCGVQPLEP